MRRIAALAIGAAAAMPLVGFARWRRTSARVTRTILSRASSASVLNVPTRSGSSGNSGNVHGNSLDSDAGSDGRRAMFTPDSLRGVPGPVIRYFQRTLSEGQRHIRSARLHQTGEFFLNGSWRPLRAEQVLSASPPAFLWDARIVVAPFVPVYVRDAYVSARASMRADILALYPIVNQAGSPELNAGALMRYLGEAAWLPTRLLPGAGLSWDAIDQQRARATLVDGPTVVSLEFTFNEQGDIMEVFSPARFRDVNGTSLPTPWRVRALGHDVHHGIRLMSPAVAEWLLPEGPLAYWRARVTDITYSY